VPFFFKFCFFPSFRIKVILSMVNISCTIFPSTEYGWFIEGFKNKQILRLACKTFFFTELIKKEKLFKAF